MRIFFASPPPTSSAAEISIVFGSELGSVQDLSVKTDRSIPTVDAALSGKFTASFSSSEALESTTAMIIRSDCAIFYDAQTVHFEVESREPLSFGSTLCFTPVQNHALPAPLFPFFDLSADIIRQAETSPTVPRTSRKSSQTYTHSSTYNQTDDEGYRPTRTALERQKRPFQSIILGGRTTAL